MECTSEEALDLLPGSAQVHPVTSDEVEQCDEIEAGSPSKKTSSHRSDGGGRRKFKNEDRSMSLDSLSISPENVKEDMSPTYNNSLLRKKPSEPIVDPEPPGSSPPSMMVVTGSTPLERFKAHEQDTNEVARKSMQGALTGPKELRKSHTLANRKVLEAIIEQKVQQSCTDHTEYGLCRSKARALVFHPYFQVLISFVIVLNSCNIGLETEFTRSTAEVKVPAYVWYIIEVHFTTIFALELAANLIAKRLEFFYDPWNVFDFILVCTALIDTLILHYIQDGAQLGILVALRIVRLSRLVRIFRLLKAFKELWLLVKGVFDAMRTLIWAWILMGLLIYIFAIFATKMIGQVDHVTPEVEEFFGTVPWSMYTLFTVMTTEGWADVARASMDVESWTWIFFIFFLSITTFAIMNVVVAVVVQNTLETAVHDKESLMAREQAQTQKALDKMMTVFTEADIDGNGELTKEEFMGAIECPSVQKLLHEVGIDIRQAENLFDILDYDESGVLEAQEFIEGVMMTRGDAKAKDVLAVQCDLWKAEKHIRTAVKGLSAEVKERFLEMDTYLGAVSEQGSSLLLAARGTPSMSGA